MKRGGNVVSYAHERLTVWGDRRDALGRGGDTVIGRMMDSAGIQPEGTHGDPTVSLQIRDEPVYDCEKAVEALSQEDAETAAVIVDCYAKRLKERDIALQQGISRRQVEERLLSGRSWVGCYLLMGRNRANTQDVAQAS